MQMDATNETSIIAQNCASCKFPNTPANAHAPIAKPAIIPNNGLKHKAIPICRM